MPEVYNKKLSLFVAWFNILVSIAFIVYSFVTYLVAHKDDASEYFYSGLMRVMIMTVPVIPWLIVSIVLVKGINQNRPKLMAAWIYLGYLVIILGLGGIIYATFTVAMWSGNLKRALTQTLPMMICWAILLLCIIPVRNLHKKMSIPPPLYHNQVVMVTQVPTEGGPGYMPVFQNV